MSSRTFLYYTSTYRFVLHAHPSLPQEAAPSDGLGTACDPERLPQHSHKKDHQRPLAGKRYYGIRFFIMYGTAMVAGIV